MLNNQYGALFARTLSAPQTTGPYGLLDEITDKEPEFPRLEASGVDFDVASTFDLDAVGLKSARGLRRGVAGADLERRDDFPFAAEASRANPAKFGLNDPDWARTVSAEETSGPPGWICSSSTPASTPSSAASTASGRTKRSA